MSESAQDMNSTKSPKVFISYSHDTQKHKDRVLELSDFLRSWGINCSIDQYESSPIKGWPLWMETEVESAEFVLIICTKNYEQKFSGQQEESGGGRGVVWEGSIIKSILYKETGKNSKFIPIVFSNEDRAFIPKILCGTSFYYIADITPEGCEDIYRRLTKQHDTPKPELGKLRVLPPCERKQVSSDASTSIHQPSQLIAKPANYDHEIATLEKEKSTLMSQLQGTRTGEDMKNIFTEIESKSKQIEEIKQKRKPIDSDAANLLIGSIRQNWEDKLVKIDFKKAKELIEKFDKDVLQNSDNDRRYALWLLEDTIDMEGKLMLRWLENYLRTCGNWTRPFVHEFTTTVNKEDFIRALATEYSISPETELSEMIRVIKAKFRVGEIFFIKIAIPKGSPSEFLMWFVQEFWQPFTQNFDGSFTVIGAISILCELSKGSLDGIVCNLKGDRQKIICLELENWTENDIEMWLRSHSGLGQKGYSVANFKDVANVVWELKKGRPISTLHALVSHVERLSAEAN